MQLKVLENTYLPANSCGLIYDKSSIVALNRPAFILRIAGT